MDDLELLEVDRELVRVGHRLLQLRERCLAELDRRHAVLDGVGPEDVAEARRDDDAEAGVLEPPGGVLARRAAAEVAAGDQDLRTLKLGSVELETGILRPVEEEELA